VRGRAWFAWYKLHKHYFLDLFREIFMNRNIPKTDKLKQYVLEREREREVS